MKRKIHTAYVRTSQELEVPSEATAWTKANRIWQKES
jgi:hypothetical protein